MIVTIIISLVFGASIALIQFLLKIQKRKKLNLAWESCNCKFDQLIDQMKQLNDQSVKSNSLIFLNKYDKKLHVIDFDTNYEDCYFLKPNKRYPNYSNKAHFTKSYLAQEMSLS